MDPVESGRHPRRRLLLFFTSADHPHRDPVCATLAWLANAEGALFECYFDSGHSGIHFGGGHPGWYQPEDLRGSTITGGRHVETVQLLATRFQCEAACLGPSLHEESLRAAGIPLRSTAPDVATFYREIFAAAPEHWPSALLVVGQGGRPQGVQLTPYAFPEIVGQRALAIADRDWTAADDLATGLSVRTLWLDDGRSEAWARRGYDAQPVASPPLDTSVSEQTAWMAERWGSTRERGGFLLGDPELVGRWAPTAVREGLMPLYGIPQVDVIDRMADRIADQPMVYGRQHHDRDFVRLSQLGVGFQVIDPGSPPFPVVSEITPRWDTPVADQAEPTDAQLGQWAEEGRVLISLLFWTGMIRELQNLFPLADLLSLSGLWSGLVVTTESFRFAAGTPLGLVNVPRESGGLWPRVELLLTDTGSGVMLAADAPQERFAQTLKNSVAQLATMLGGTGRLPVGWWAHMDAPLVPGRPPRVSRFPDPPRVRIRYQHLNRELSEPVTASPAAGRPSLRGLVRDSPVGRYFAPLRPYEAHHPGRPSRTVLEAVRAAGFEYAITKAAFGPVPRVVSDLGGLTVFNHTAGRWDGWSPFLTVNALPDLERAERRLLRGRRPGWLVGALDTCLWAFTGPVWQRASELRALCDWAAGGGGTGKLINVTPHTVARYARVLGKSGRVESIEAG